MAGKDTQTLYGLRAVTALWKARPEALLKLYHGPNQRHNLGAMLSWMAARRLSYREVEALELEKVAGSPHHEGLVAVAQALTYLPWPETLPPTENTGAPWVALDGVDNPHNLGAIVRSCAFFGVPGVLVGGVAPEATINAGLMRVSEGGVEQVPLYGIPDLPAALKSLAKGGMAVLGLETDGVASLSEAAHAESGRTVLVLGREREGLATGARQACTAICALHGAGDFNSLNVSVATGVALSVLSRGGNTGSYAGSSEEPEPPPPQPKTKKEVVRTGRRIKIKGK